MYSGVKALTLVFKHDVRELGCDMFIYIWFSLPNGTLLFDCVFVTYAAVAHVNYELIAPVLLFNCVLQCFSIGVAIPIGFSRLTS